MTLNQLARLFGKAAVVARDVNAVKRGRIGQRVTNRFIGRSINRVMRGRWR